MRYINHMKKKHKEYLERAEKAFENKCKKWLHSLRQRRFKSRQDSSKFAEKEREKKKKSRKKLKEENPEREKEKRRIEWRRFRYGEKLPNSYHYLCSMCWEKPAFYVIKTPQMKEAMTAKALECLQKAKSADISTFQHETI